MSPTLNIALFVIHRECFWVFWFTMFYLLLPLSRIICHVASHTNQELLPWNCGSQKKYPNTIPRLPNLRNITLYNVIVSLIPWTLGNECALFKSPSLLLQSLPHITCFNIKSIYRRFHSTCSHTSCCHHCHYHDYCNIDFVWFHNATCHTNSIIMHPC